MGKAVCVYCGARDGRDPAYGAAAAETGRMIAGNGWGLVYGAGDVGLMGRVARAHGEAGGRALGVIPRHLVDRERALGRDGPDLDRLVVTETMHERKTVMFMNADAVAVLPGGCGSLDELFEVVTWRQLGLHAKPVLLLDVKGYWQPLLALLGHAIGEGFAGEEVRGYVTPVADVPALEAALRGALGGALGGARA